MGVRDDELRLWTIQHLDAWIAAERSGSLTADARFAEPSFAQAYEWMRTQMRARVRGYRGGLVWAWWRPKPDLRRSHLLDRGAPGVRIEFAVPVSRVVLSDFDRWHAVLNGWYLASDDADWDDFERRTSRARRGELGSSEAIRSEVEASWQRIFREPGTWSDREWVQATIDRVELGDVRSVRAFTAR